MLGQTDYVGVAAVISAIFAGVAAVIAAWNARSASILKTRTGTNGDSRELGQIASDVAKQIAPDPEPVIVPEPPPATT